MTSIPLLSRSGRVTTIEAIEPPQRSKPEKPLVSRVAFAAAHVVPDVHGENTPGQPAQIDWESTLAFRHHLWSWGLGVADAMDTAQRNMGMSWSESAELIRRTADEASRHAAHLERPVVAGIATDQIDDDAPTLARIKDAYVEQLHTVEDSGAQPVLMASRHLARIASSPADYEEVYGHVLERAAGPVVLHWLGEAFDAHLAGYFGEADFEHNADTLIRIIESHSDRVDGIKMSLLDADKEKHVRQLLPGGVRMYTGDDYNYVQLMGDEPDPDGAVRHSDALLGAFAAIAPSASAAIQALDSGDSEGFEHHLGPTLPLARHIFGPPTQNYKAGIAFLSWLNGHQPAFTMVGGFQANRSLPHLSEIVRLANAAGALERPEPAIARWTTLLRVQGISLASSAVI